MTLNEDLKASIARHTIVDEEMEVVTRRLQIVRGNALFPIKKLILVLKTLTLELLKKISTSKSSICLPS